MPRISVSFLLAVLIAAALGGPSALSASPDLVVSQLYAGGGNSGAPFANDFVELFNRGSTNVDISTWTIQYAGAAGTTWQTTALTGTVQPGHYYLVQLASAAAIGSPLPAPDATGTTNLAVSGGKVALVRGSAALSCGAAAGSCSGNAQIADFIGYGSAADYEGSGAAPAISNTLASVRADSGCSDTDDNHADFSSAAPAPRNSSSPAGSCGSQPSGGVSQPAAVDIDIQPVLSIALERSTVTFGQATSGSTPAPVSEHVTVLSNNETGYALTVHRTAFTPVDLPLGISGSAPAGGQIGPQLAGGAMAPIPIAPAPDLLIGTTSAPSTTAGDVWATSLGFTSGLPVVAAGHYAATLMFTAIGR